MRRLRHLLSFSAVLVCAFCADPRQTLGQESSAPDDDPGQDDVREAEEALLASVERGETGGDDITFANALRNLAIFYHTQHRYPEARALHERALAVRERALGRDHADVIQSLADLALLDLAEGDIASAAKLYERALRSQRKLYGRRAPETAITINNLARLHVTNGDLRRATGLYREELAILEALNGPNSMRLVSTLATLADLERQLDRPATAEAYYRRGMQIATADAASASQRRLAELLEGYAALLAALPERSAESTELARRAAELRASNPGADRRPTAD